MIPDQARDHEAKMERKSLDAAPVYYGAAEASAWADGYNSAIEVALARVQALEAKRDAVTRESNIKSLLIGDLQDDVRRAAGTRCAAVRQLYDKLEAAEAKVQALEAENARLLLVCAAHWGSVCGNAKWGQEEQDKRKALEREVAELKAKDQL